ncbi:MAG TPA: LLM class flavin-dependent oxidoreductase, partial [Acidimicrobiia bacterium]|nr:LLM class flavin-dependent oxidoreductase [Acidimicrobiia bacterium]
LLDHTLEVLQTLWREPRAAYDSPELHFEATHLMPKPRQPGGVPIWISGTVNPRVVRRLATFGSGWIPWGPAAADPVAGIAEMKERLAEAGRDPSDLQVTGTLPQLKADDGSFDVDRTMAQVPALAAAGLTDVRGRFKLPDDRSAAVDELSRIVAAFRAAAGRTD